MAGFMLLLLVSAAAMELSAAETYVVGDADGWTIGPNYEKWASSKTFSVGDTVVFKYDNQAHNTIEVTKEIYDDCTIDDGAAIDGYTTGNDRVVLESNGHRYFICGIASHCQAGQKVGIPVGVSSDSSPAATAPAAAAPGLQPTEAGLMKGLGFAVTVVIIFFILGIMWPVLISFVIPYCLGD